MKSHVRRLGNSHGLIIPKPMLDQLGIAAGDAVELKISKKERLVMTPVRTGPRSGWEDDGKILVQFGDTGLRW